MPGGFWPPGRNGNGNSSSRPLRRRRSLLGRKNRSENDLPRQDPLAPQHQPSLIQQQVQGAPHTTLVLPDNVRTILIAGTPECWNLTTSAEEFLPESCDASLLTLGSELTPGSLTIDEEEPYEESPRNSKHDNLNWLRTGRPSPSSNNARRKTDKQQRRSEQGPMKEPSSMVVMYQSPAPHPTSPQEALQVWLNSVEVLINSKEMASLLTSTRDVVRAAGGLAVKTAFLPMTLPLHVACATKDFVGWTVHQALSQTGAILQLTNHAASDQAHKPALPKSSPEAEAPTEARGTKDVKEPSAGNPLTGLLQLVPVVLHTAGKVKDEIGEAVFGLAVPPQPKPYGTCKATKLTDQEILDRLKIPGLVSEVKQVDIPKVVTPTASNSGTTKADYSKFLLRVEDLGIHAPGSDKAVVLFIDLSSEFRDQALLKSCLDNLYSEGLSLATSHAPAISPATTSKDMHVDWKPEGSTAKMLRKKVRQTPERWEEIMRSEVLIWSGNFKKECGGSVIHRQFPLFLARGIIERLSPREFLELLWNNDRTAEYNNYCMGRKDVIQIDDKVLSSRNVHSGVKVVRSETRVPFTGISVSLCTMMYCRALPGGPQEGYVILSRSLMSGMAGYHTQPSSSNIQKSKSEILWGVNVLRAVPGHPGQTELTSVSQVASTMVPKFLSQKIGTMGVEDFFRNVRSTPKVSCSPPSPSSANDTPLSCSNSSVSCASVQTVL